MIQTKSETKIGFCCPSGSEPDFQTNYTPKGQIENLDGLPIYTIGQGEKAIIFAYDIYGFDSGRTKQMCDELAEAGYFVILPDFFRDDGWKSSDMEGFFGFLRLLRRFKRNVGNWDTKGCDDFQKRIYPYLERKGVKKIGMLGTCWGSYYVWKASAEGRISAGANFHPSLRLKKQTPVEMARELKCPQLMLLGKNDPENHKEGSEAAKVCKEKFGEISEFKTFPEMKHGWVVRGDIKNANIERDAKIAMDTAIEFFRKTL